MYECVAKSRAKVYLVLVFTLLLTALSSITVNAKPIAVMEEEKVGYIYLGDSRFVGMNKYCNIDEEENTWVVAKVGQGLKWMKETALPEIEEIVNNNSDITEWFLITGLGVNDLGNIDKYIEVYDDLDGFEIILVSVNPMEKSKADKWGYDYNGLSPKIVKFNEKLLETSYQYIDVYNDLIENGYKTVDGLHYDKETYKYIYSIINSYMKGGESEDEESLSGL